MLVNAGVRYGGGPIRYSGAALVAATERGAWLQPGMLRNIDAGYAATVETDEAAAYPSGNNHPNAWVLAQKSGAISSRFQAGGSSALTALGASGINIEAALAGFGSLTADITYILFVDAVATLTGVGAISADGSYITFVNIDADLSGAGSLTADATYLAFVNAIATLSGTSTFAADGLLGVNTSATLAGSGALAASGFISKEMATTLTGTSNVAAVLQAIGEAVASITGAGALTAQQYATGDMSADLSLESGALTPQSIARSVWESLAAEYTNTSTFGGQARFSYLLAHNKTVTDPVAGTITVYDTDGTTVLFVADLYEDAAGTTPYQGQGADRRDSF